MTYSNLSFIQLKHIDEENARVCSKNLIKAKIKLFYKNKYLDKFLKIFKQFYA